MIASTLSTQPYTKPRLNCGVRLAEILSPQHAPILVAMDIVVDTQRRLITFKDKPVKLRPKPYDVLLLLMQNSGTPVSKQLIIDKVWNGRPVSDDVITRVLRDIRKALDLSAADKTYIRTIPKVGYQFSPSVSSSEDDNPRDSSKHPLPKSTIVPSQNRQNKKWWAGVFVLSALCIVVTLFFMFNKKSSVNAATVMFARIQFDDELPVPVLALPNEITRLTRNYASLTDKQGQATHLFYATADKQNASRWQLSLQDIDTKELLGSFELPMPDSNTVEDHAMLLLHNTDHILRCLRDLAFIWQQEPAQEQINAQTMLFTLCRQSLDVRGFFQIQQIGAQIAKSLPHNGSAQALYYLLLVTQSGHYIEGRNDVETAARKTKLAALYAHLPEDFSQHPLWPIVHRFHQIEAGDYQTLMKVASMLPPENWLALSSRTMMIDTLRFSGRIKEASALAAKMTRYWPAFPTSLMQELLSTLAVHGYEETLQKKETLLPFQAEQLPQNLPAIWAGLYSTDEQQTLSLIEQFPRSIHTCMQAFVRLRFYKQQFASEVVQLPTHCEQLDATMKARLTALLGDYESALSMVKDFDDSASGPALTLHYPEYKTLWLDNTMWQQAERFGMLRFWKQTGIKPDLCALSQYQAICSYYLE